MLVATFVGYCNHIDEIDYDIVVVDEYFNNCQNVNLRNAIYHNTNEPDLRLRLKKQLLRVLEEFYYSKETQFAIIDSDLIIPNLRKIDARNSIISPCYFALHKGKGYIAPWCFGTNFIFDKIYLSWIYEVVKNYQDTSSPIDGYIHFHLLIRHVIIPGTTHYIKMPNGTEIKKIITENDLQEITNHNFIPVEILKY